MNDDKLRRDYEREFRSDPFRPRDKYDVDVHPESVRGKALALMDETAEAIRMVDAAIAAAPWYQRFPLRLVRWWYRR